MIGIEQSSHELQLCLRKHALQGLQVRWSLPTTQDSSLHLPWDCPPWDYTSICAADQRNCTGSSAASKAHCIALTLDVQHFETPWNID